MKFNVMSVFPLDLTSSLYHSFKDNLMLSSSDNSQNMLRILKAKEFEITMQDKTKHESS